MVRPQLPQASSAGLHLTLPRTRQVTDAFAAGIVTRPAARSWLALPLIQTGPVDPQPPLAVRSAGAAGRLRATVATGQRRSALGSTVNTLAREVGRAMVRRAVEAAISHFLAVGEHLASRSIGECSQIEIARSGCVGALARVVGEQEMTAGLQAGDGDPEQRRARHWSRPSHRPPRRDDITRPAFSDDWESYGVGCSGAGCVAAMAATASACELPAPQSAKPSPEAFTIPWI
jgi:hypothetical protein